MNGLYYKLSKHNGANLSLSCSYSLPFDEISLLAYLSTSELE